MPTLRAAPTGLKDLSLKRRSAVGWSWSCLAVRCLASPSLARLLRVCLVFFLNQKDVRRRKRASIIRKKQRFPKTQNEWGNERTGIRVVAKTGI